MKKFLSIYGVSLFLFVTYLFFDDFRRPWSSLYKKDFLPMVVKELLPQYSLSPGIMFYIYIVVLVGIILTIKFKETHIIATIGNLIISIPIFMVHKDTLFFEPFYFMYSYSYCRDIIMWVWYIYFSLFGGIMLAMYLFFNSNKLTQHQKKKIKKIIKISLVSVTLFAVIYISQCIYLSIKTDYLVRLSYDNNGEYTQELKDTISKEDFEQLDYERYQNKESKESVLKYSNTFPFSLVSFKQARSWYWYDNIYLYFPKIVSYELKNFKWVVTDVYEHP